MNLLFSQAMWAQEDWTGVYDSSCVINMHEDAEVVESFRCEGEW